MSSWQKAGMVVFGAITVILAAVVYMVAQDHTDQRTAHEAQSRLTLVVESLKTSIDRVDGMPRLVGASRLIDRILDSPKEPSNTRSANEFLRAASKENGLEAAFLLNHDGVAIASSNFSQPVNYLGANYGFRPYFQSAKRDGYASYYGVGATTGRPGFFLASKVTSGTGAVGVVVLKASFAKLEKSWKESGEHVLVSDKEGVVFLTDNEEMRYRTVQELSPAIKALLVSERRYATLSLGAVIDYFKDLPPGSIASKAVEGTPWQVALIVPAPSRIRQPKSAAITVLLLGALILSVIIIGKQEKDRRNAVRRKNRELEEEVEKRTEELVQAMAKLEDGVAARRASEQKLAEARDDLIQAGKLASMGQAFAGLAHEVNQPLAALRTYISSTKLLIDRNDNETAISNLVVMDTTVERLATLTRDLKHLSRRSDDTLSEVDLAETARRIVNLMRFRISDAGAVVNERIEKAVKVVADPTRVDQVVLNLVKNAVDATSEAKVKKIMVAVRGDKGMAVLSVGDLGPGIAESVKGRLFEPFFTTKGVGKGLGLGLAISYAIARDYDGALTYERTREGETWFHLSLPRLSTD